MNTLLIVDDEEKIRESLRDTLEDEGYEVIEASDGKEAVRIVETNAVDVILLDLWLPEIGGMDVIDRVKDIDDNIQIIIITGHGSVDAAVKATKKGAFDFLEKPLSSSKVLTVVRNALEVRRLQEENIKLKASTYRVYPMVKGVSDQFKEIENLVERCSESNARVFITGENGTGKEIIARWIHDKSKRKNKPFVAVNCAAIPQTLIEAELFGYEKGAFTGAIRQKKGRFEIANGGTIFLDEIADMSLEAQAKVLRVIEEMQFERVGGTDPISLDVRIIVATNKDIQKEISEGRFRDDLFYRLNVVPIHIPPLRERREDIPPLIDFYLDYFARENDKARKTLNEEAYNYLVYEYDWPGNIRELKNLIERLNILSKGKVITIEDVKMSIPFQAERPYIGSGVKLKEARYNFERLYVTNALKKNRYNITKTAKDLGVERSNLYKLMKRLNIKIESNSK